MPPRSAARASGAPCEGSPEAATDRQVRPPSLLRATVSAPAPGVFCPRTNNATSGRSGRKASWGGVTPASIPA